MLMRPLMGELDGRVIEPRLREFHLRVVLGNLRRVLTDQHPLLVGLLLRGKVVLEQFLVAPQIGFGVLELNGRAIALRLRQVKLGLVHRRVDIDERVADLDVLSLLEGHLRDDAVDLGR